MNNCPDVTEEIVSELERMRTDATIDDYNDVLAERASLSDDDVEAYKKDRSLPCPYCHGEDDQCTLCDGVDYQNSESESVSMSPTQPWSPPCSSKRQRETDENDRNADNTPKRQKQMPEKIHLRRQTHKICNACKRCASDYDDIQCWKCNREYNKFEWNGIFYCTECNIFMGDQNPRQLCGKTHCDNDGSWHEYDKDQSLKNIIIPDDSDVSYTSPMK